MLSAAIAVSPNPAVPRCWTKSEQLTVASDSVNGPLIGVIDASGEALAKEGAVAVSSLEDMVAKMTAPRAIWVMLPAGKITEDTIVELTKLLARDDIIIDGGNTFWRDDVRRAKTLKERAIHYVDVGTSGGVWGL